MTTLAVGSSVTVAPRDNGTVAIATNGGFGSITVTPTGGAATTTNFGPAPVRQVFGPYAEGAIVTLTNSSCNALDYDAGPDFMRLQTRIGTLGTLLLMAAGRASRNHPFDLGVMSSPPTVTSPGTAPTPARQTGFWATNGRSQFRALGVTSDAFLVQYATHYLKVSSCRTAASTYQNASSGFEVEFVTDAPNLRFEFFGGDTLPVFIAVGTPEMTGMQLTNAAGHTAAAGVSSYQVDWAGSRVMRGYRIYCALDHGFGRISIGEDDTLYAPSTPLPRILDIGDSIVANTLSPSAPNYFPFPSVTRAVSGCDVVGHGIGSSGYVAGTALSTSWRIEDAAAANADLIRLHLGINDAGQTAAVVKAAARSALQALRAAVGDTPIEVKGPFGGNKNASADLLAVEAGLQEAVAAVGGRMVFTPTVTASNTNWPEVLGTNDTNTTGGAAGNSEFMTGDDGTHPSKSGAEYFARRRWASTLAAVAAAGW